MASAANLNAVNTITNGKTAGSNGNTGGLSNKDSNLWKSAESLNAFANSYICNNQGQQIPITTWPRTNNEL